MNRSFRKDLGQFSFRSAQSRDKIDSAPGAFARECDVAAIRRPDWIEVRGGIGRQPQRLPSVNQFDIDVRIIFLRAVPNESDLGAVRGKRRLGFAARKAGDWNYLRLRAGAFGLRLSAEFVESEGNPANRDDQRC